MKAPLLIWNNSTLYSSNFKFPNECFYKDYVKMQVHKCKNCFWGNAFIPLCIHWENPLLETKMVSSMDNGNPFILGKSGCIIQSIHRRIILLFCLSFFSRNKNGAIYFGRKSKALTRLLPRQVKLQSHWKIFSNFYFNLNCDETLNNIGRNSIW